jgi:hypothetical protein
VIPPVVLISIGIPLPGLEFNVWIALRDQIGLPSVVPQTLVAIDIGRGGKDSL